MNGISESSYESIERVNSIHLTNLFDTIIYEEHLTLILDEVLRL